VRPAASLRDRVAAGPELLDALAAPSAYCCASGRREAAMLKGNLSSRPFYNERLVSAALVLIAALVLALTVFNGFKLYALSKQRAELKGRIGRDTAQAQQIEPRCVALQRSVDRATLVQLAGSTQEANTLIDQRTFRGPCSSVDREDAAA